MLILPYYCPISLILVWTCWIIPSCRVSTRLANRKWTWERPSSISTLWRCFIANLSSLKCTGIFEWSPSHLGPNSEQSNCHARAIKWDGASPKKLARRQRKMKYKLNRYFAQSGYSIESPPTTPPDDWGSFSILSLTFFSLHWGQCMLLSVGKGYFGYMISIWLVYY